MTPAARVTRKGLSGYCWPQSLLPGETVAIFCHSEARQLRVQVVRRGSADDVVLDRANIQVHAQPETGDVARDGCAWEPCLQLVIDGAWPSGFYLVRLLDADGTRAEAFFVVRSTEPLDALLVLSTSTWAAYNDWGGPSYYTGGHTVSLERPLPRGFLDKADPGRHRIARYQDWSDEDARAFAAAGYSQWCMAAGWANWEWLFVRWAEAEGYRLGYATSSDLDGDGDLLSGYPAYLSVGHDEYWTAAMRDNVEGYVDAGGHAAFFSGNTAFWQARFEADHSRLVCFKNAIGDDPCFQAGHAPDLSTMWSDPLVGRPENAMTGVSFTRGGYAHMRNAPRGTGGYQVWQPAHWAFESLSLRAGDALGARAVVVGYECDGCELVERDGTPFPSGVDGTPADFEVLATAPARLWETQDAPEGLHESYIGELNWVAERIGGEDSAQNRERFGDGRAVLGTFRRGRGEVFTTGCTDWAYGLDEPDVATVTGNVLRRFVHGSKPLRAR